jgi:hypothetical protein
MIMQKFNLHGFTSVIERYRTESSMWTMSHPFLFSFCPSEINAPRSCMNLFIYTLGFEFVQWWAPNGSIGQPSPLHWIGYSIEFYHNPTFILAEAYPAFISLKELVGAEEWR